MIEKAGREAELQLADQPHGMGSCHLLWAAQKEILRDKYGVDWRTPAEMNAGDVWFPQPPKDHPWRTMPHHGMTPHISGTTLSTQAR